jgi:hypothetical protein
LISSPLKNTDESIQEVNLQWDVSHPFQNTPSIVTKANYTNKRILKPGEALIFEVENSQITEDSSLFELLPANINAAIARVPAWLHYDLQFKFKMITQSSHRTKMVDLLNNTPKQYLDEVAFS